jgi:hypothetical protein
VAGCKAEAKDTPKAVGDGMYRIEDVGSRISFDHGAGHPFLFLGDAKAPHYRENKGQRTSAILLSGRRGDQGPRIRPEWPLRLGCGCVNLYAGFFLLTDPAHFYTYVPSWLSRVANAVASVDAYLRLQGVGEVMIAIGLLGWFFPRWCVRLASTLLAVEMMLILLCGGVDAVLFRNIGILGAALSLLISSYQDTRG